MTAARRYKQIAAGIQPPPVVVAEPAAPVVVPPLVVAQPRRWSWRRRMAAWLAGLAVAGPAMWMIVLGLSKPDPLMLVVEQERADVVRVERALTELRGERATLAEGATGWEAEWRAESLDREIAEAEAVLVVERAEMVEAEQAAARN